MKFILAYIFRLSILVNCVVLRSKFYAWITTVISAMMLFDGCHIGFTTWIYVREYPFDVSDIMCFNKSSSSEYQIALTEGINETDELN